MKLYLLSIVYTAVTAINCSQGSIDVSITPGLKMGDVPQKLTVIFKGLLCKSDTDQPIDDLKLSVSANGKGSCFPNLSVPSADHTFTITMEGNSKSIGSGTLKFTSDTFNLFGTIKSGTFIGNKLNIVGKGTVDLLSTTAACLTTGVNSFKYQVESLSIKP